MASCTLAILNILSSNSTGIATMFSKFERTFKFPVIWQDAPESRIQISLPTVFYYLNVFHNKFMSLCTCSTMKSESVAGPDSLLVMFGYVSLALYHLNKPSLSLFSTPICCHIDLYDHRGCVYVLCLRFPIWWVPNNIIAIILLMSISPTMPTTALLSRSALCRKAYRSLFIWISHSLHMVFFLQNHVKHSVYRGKWFKDLVSRF